MKALFRSLRVRNYRLFFAGQFVSIAGTWMQAIALDWLVLRLTSSGVAIGLNAALQFGPMLLLGPIGGLIADRFRKRRLLVLTQCLFLLQAVTLGVLTAGGWTRLWMVYALSATYGLINVVDNPSRQAIVSQLVEPADLMNAVGLSTAVFNTGRIAGPAAAGLLIATVGLPICFFINAATYVAIISGLLLMRESQFFGRPSSAKGRGQIVAGFRYVRRTPQLLVPLILMGVVGTFGLNFRTFLPLLTRFTFHSGPHTYGVLSSVMAVGSLTGALIAAARRAPSRRLLVGAAVAFGVLEVVAAFAPTLGAAYLALPAVGMAGMLFISTGNTWLQMHSSDEMRGRVLALFSLVFLGSTPIGGPIMGWISQHWSPRHALAVGGVLSLAGALATAPVLLRQRRAVATGLEVAPSTP